MMLAPKPPSSAPPSAAAPPTSARPSTRVPTENSPQGPPQRSLVVWSVDDGLVAAIVRAAAIRDQARAAALLPRIALRTQLRRLAPVAPSNQFPLL